MMLTAALAEQKNKPNLLAVFIAITAERYRMCT